MARRSLRLDPVLRMRLAAERRAQRELADLLRRRVALRDQLAALQERIAHARQSVAGALVGTVDVDHIMGFARYSSQGEQRARELVSQGALLEKQVDAARGRLAAATRARRAIELLQERERAQRRRDARRREQVGQDDMAASRYVRGGADGIHT